MSSPPPPPAPPPRRDRRAARRRPALVLIFVVVLLALLAIMGVAYLAASRADRVGIRAPRPVPGVAVPRVFDASGLERLAGGVGGRVQQELIGDLFNLQPGALRPKQQSARPPSPVEQAALFAAFRQTLVEPGSTGGELGVAGVPFYEDYDAPGRADPWLAALLPTNPAANDYRWPWIGAPLAGESRGGSATFGAPLAREVLPGVDLEPFFADPRDLAVNGFAKTWADQSAADPALEARRDVRITSVAMLRSQARGTSSRNTRVYPALKYAATTRPAATPGGTAIAADADGDGIADAGLMPVALHPERAGVARYLDEANGVVYLVGYRVVDNSAQLNLTTALSVQGDVSTDAQFRVTTSADDDAAGNPELRNALTAERSGANAVGYADAPNFGFFRANVGLVELVREALRPYSAASSRTDVAARRELERLVDARFPALGATPASDADGGLVRRLARDGDPNVAGVAGVTTPGTVTGDRDAALASAVGSPYRYRSFADLLEQQSLARPDASGVLWRSPTNASAALLDGALVALPPADAAALAAKNGALLDVRAATPASVEAALPMTLRLATPNFSASSEQSWEWFPPDAVGLWYDWTKSFEPSRAGDPAATPTAYGRIGLLDAAAGADERVVRYAPPTGMGFAAARMVKSVRSLVTTYNGVTSLAPRRRDLAPLAAAATGLPWGMPGYGEDATKDEFPATRVAAATGSKEQLFRAYWSAMTQQSAAAGRAVVDRKRALSPGGATLTFDAFAPSDRHASDVSDAPVGGSAEQHRLDESQMALVRAACAACNTIDLRDPDDDVTAMTVDLGNVEPGVASSDHLFARVYGSERQLVISAVVIDDDPAGAFGVYVELFNPSDAAIDLTGYRIGVLQRRAKSGLPPTPPVTLATGAVSVPPAITSQRPLVATPTLLPPGGYVVVTNRAAADPLPPGISGRGGAATLATMRGSDVVIADAVDDLRQVKGPLGAQRDRELVLMRTRRADGRATTEDPALAAVAAPGFRRPPFSESAALNDPDGLLSLVPVDAVDLRTLEYPNVAVSTGSGQRYAYVRATVPYDAPGTPGSDLEQAQAWKCFYAGQFYALRPTVAPTTRPAQPEPLAPPSSGGWAWRQYPVSATASAPSLRAGQVVLAAPRERAGIAAPPTGPDLAEPYLAPTIPVQNFTPDATAHPADRFPFGSPFARDGDVVAAVPFVGSYKVYRIKSGYTAADPPTLYEYVPLPMDAWSAAPVPDEAYAAVGRFDPRPRPGVDGNEWADDLFDFVAARQRPAANFPDVPRVAPGDHNDPLVPATDQDGPVVGLDRTPRDRHGPDDPAFRVPWVRWSNFADGSTTSERRGGAALSANGPTLIQGVGNLNTMPAVVRRMLPFAVDGVSGRVDTQANGASDAANRQRAKAAAVDDYIRPLQGRDADAPTFGISNVSEVGDAVRPAAEAPRSLTAAQKMMAGDLQPFHRPPPALDEVALRRDATRLSNLASPRSDVFTVYLTVQAWTWVGANQSTDTRLVGETRRAFVVDRSRIDATHFALRDLVVMPVDNR